MVFEDLQKTAKFGRESLPYPLQCVGAGSLLTSRADFILTGVIRMISLVIFVSAETPTM